MPTGVALRDAREQLFGAAERLLLSDGPGALTSRAVTAEAGVAKGVLHRHFADFDAFLAEFALDHLARFDGHDDALRQSAGTGTIAGNLTEVLTALFQPVGLAMIRLVIARDELRARLRRARAARVPFLSDAAAMISAYLAAEQDLGRLAPDADPGSLAAMLVGTGHLLFAERESPPPDAAAVREVVAAVLGGKTAA